MDLGQGPRPHLRRESQALSSITLLEAERSRPSTSHCYNSHGSTNSSTMSRRCSPRSIAISSRNQAQLWWIVPLTNTSTDRSPSSRRAALAPSPPRQPAPRPSPSSPRRRAIPKTNASKRQHLRCLDSERVGSLRDVARNALTANSHLPLRRNRHHLH